MSTPADGHDPTQKDRSGEAVLLCFQGNVSDITAGVHAENTPSQSWNSQAPVQVPTALFGIVITFFSGTRMV